MTRLPPVLRGQKETPRLAEPHAAAVLQYWVEEPPITQYITISNWAGRQGVSVD